MDAIIISDEEGFGKCAWCGSQIDEEFPVYGFGIMFKSAIDLSKFEGKFIELSILTQNKTVPMLITIEGSDAKEDGNDAMFMTCTEKCGKEMKDAMLKEKSLGNMFDRINHINN